MRWMAPEKAPEISISTTKIYFWYAKYLFAVEAVHSKASILFCWLPGFAGDVSYLGRTPGC
jgi:hypothetical protein